MSPAVAQLGIQLGGALLGAAAAGGAPRLDVVTPTLGGANAQRLSLQRDLDALGQERLAQAQAAGVTGAGLGGVMEDLGRRSNDALVEMDGRVMDVVNRALRQQALADYEREADIFGGRTEAFGEMLTGLGAVDFGEVFGKGKEGADGSDDLF